MLNLADEHRIIRAGDQIAESYECKVGTIEEVNEIQEEEEQEDADQAGDEATKKQQFHKLLTDLKIRDNELLKENPAIRQKLMEILERHQDVFSSPGKKIGRTNLMEFTARTVPGA